MADSGRRRAVPGRARPIRDAGAPMSRAASSRLASKQLMTAIIALPGVPLLRTALPLPQRNR